MSGFWLERLRASWIRPAGRRPRARQARLGVEALEDRLSPAILGAVQGPNAINDPVIVSNTLYFFDGQGSLWSLASPGAAAQPVATTGAVSDLAASNGTLYFVAKDGQGNEQLFAEFGTGPNGQLSHFQNTAAPGSVKNLTPVGNWLAFSAYNSATLSDTLCTFSSNGLGSNLNPIANPSPLSLTAAGSNLFFVGNDTTNGTQLWDLAGPTATPTMLTDVNPGPAAGLFSVSGLVAVGSNVYFTSGDVSGKWDVWGSDGSLPGTTTVLSGLASVPSIEALGGNLYITAGGQSYTTNTVTPMASLYPFAQVGTTTFYIQSSATPDYQLWAGQGDFAALALNPSELNDFGSLSPANPFATASTLYFTLPGSSGQLWKSDGTSGGTAQVAKTANLALASGVSTQFDGAILFMATPVVNGSPSGNPTLYYLLPNAAATTQTALATSQASINDDLPVTFTATVSSSQGTPTGSVTFSDGNTPLGTIPFNAAGIALFTTSSLTVGQHQITANYSGNSDFQLSISAALPETVQATTQTSLGTSSSSVTIGQPVTLTASVTSTPVGSPTGTVTFMDGAVNLGSVSVSNGWAILTTSQLTVGSNSLTASYSGDTLDAGSLSSAITVQGSAIATQTTLTTSQATVNPGQSVTFTATVSAGQVTPTGSISFLDGTTPLGNVPLNANGIATFMTSSLAAGQHGITAVYAANGNFQASTSTALTETVKAPTQTSLSTSSSSVTIGQSVTLTATVSSTPAGSPTGAVTFMDGAVTLGSIGVSNGQAILATSQLTVGANSITASYSGDAGDVASQSSAINVQVALIQTQTTLTTSQATVNPGQSVTFTATASAGQGTPTGSISFLDGTTPLGSVPLNASGIATFTTMSLSSGQHHITAVYAANGNFQASTSTALTETVKATTQTNLNTSATSVMIGQSVTLTATVASTPAGSPTGTVTFMDGTVTLGSATIANGKAILTTAQFTLGSNSITANYAGDATNVGSQSVAVTVQVTTNPTKTTLGTSQAIVNAGQLVSFTATVSATKGTPTGSVSFLDGNTPLGSVPVNASGVAVFTTLTLSAGQHQIKAVYAGSSTYQGSTSAPVAETVKAASQTHLTVSTPVAMPGQQVTLTVSVSSTANGTPTGTVTFMDSAVNLGSATLANGKATLVTAKFVTGSNAITAVYSGDGTHVASQSPAVKIQVTANPSFQLTASAAAANYGQPVTLTAIAIPGDTGVVIFTAGANVLGTAALNAAGVATLSVNSLGVGPHSLTALLNGVKSSAVAFTVNPDPTTVTLNTSSVTLTVGQTIALTATVGSSVGGQGIPGGVVTFLNGTKVLGTATLNASGVASLTGIKLGAGTHNLQVSYAGQGHFAGSASAKVAVTVSKDPTQIAEQVTHGTVPPGVPGLLFKVSVSSTGPLKTVPTGTISFWDGATLIAQQTLSATGTCTITISQTRWGTLVIAGLHFTYSGDASFQASSLPLILV